MKVIVKNDVFISLMTHFCAFDCRKRWSNQKDDTAGTLISDYAERQFDTCRSKNTYKHTYIHTYIHAGTHTHIKLSCVFTHVLGTYSKNVLRWFSVFFDDKHSLSMLF